MKLRLKGDSIRLRLTKTEVTQVGMGQPVFEKTHFAGGTMLTYILEPSHASEVMATYDDAQVKIQIPMRVALDWAQSSTVEIKRQIGPLFILIEKDFFCLKPREHQIEDERDMFFNPNLDKGCCG